MDTMEIVRVHGDQDLESVKDLCRELREWLVDRFVDHPNVVNTYYNEATYEDLLDSLASIHAPPKGCILLAKANGSPLGCVMLQELEPGVCEMKRMVVSKHGRGTGVGSALVEASIREGNAMGYHTMRLDTGHPQHEAYALYKKHGFVDRTPYYDAPAEVAEILHFLERPLTD